MDSPRRPERQCKACSGIRVRKREDGAENFAQRNPIYFIAFAGLTEVADDVLGHISSLARLVQDGSSNVVGRFYKTN